VPTWRSARTSALVLVMAAGVNYNGVWAALGKPISPHRRAQEPVSHRGLRRRRACVYAVGLQGEALEGRRRGRHPLQSGRWRRRGVQRRRPDVLANSQRDLGLRDAGRLLRAVRPRAGAPAACRKPPAPHLGRGVLLHAHAGHRLPHAVRPSPAYAACPATTCWSGARRAASGRWRVQLVATTGRQRHRRHLGATTRRTSSCSSAPRASSTATSSTAGARCQPSARPKYNDVA
jgi:hypothetical protein